MDLPAVGAVRPRGPRRAASTPSWSGEAWRGPASRPPTDHRRPGQRRRAPAAKPATRSTRPGDVVAEAQRARLRLTGGAQAPRRPRRLGPRGRSSRGAAAWTPARPPVASPTCCCAAAPPASSPSTWGTAQLAWPLRRRARHRDGAGERPRSAPESRGAARPGRRRPVVHLAAPVMPALTACAAARADLVMLVKPQFEVGQVAWAREASCAIRRCGRERCAASPRLPRARPCGPRRPASPLPGPRATSSTSWLGRFGASVTTEPREPRPRKPVCAEGHPGRAEWTDDDDAEAPTVLITAHTGRRAARRSARLVIRRFAAGVGLSPSASWTPEADEIGAQGWTWSRRNSGVAATPSCSCVLGGDGTLLRGAELARPAGPAAGRQPRPRGLPRRGRAGGPRRHRGPRS